MSRAMQLHQANQDEASKTELANADRALDQGLGDARSPEIQSDLYALAYQVALAKRDRPLAEKTLARLSVVAPDAPMTALLVSEAAAEQGKLEDAKRTIEQSLRFHPNSEELRWFAGTNALERGDHETANLHFDRLVAIGTAKANDWALAGRVGHALSIAGPAGDSNDSVEELSSAVASDVTQAVFVIEELGSRSHSLELLLRKIATHGVEIRPDDTGLSFVKAYVDRASGYPEQCIHEVDRILARGAGDRETDLLWLACQAHGDLDQPDSAIVRARSLLAKTPWHIPALSLFVQATLRTPAESPDRKLASKFLEGARAHFESTRRSIAESEERDPNRRRAMLRDSDRYLSMIEEMESAIGHRG